MTKKDALKLWRDGDDSAIAREVGVTKRTIRHWRIAGKVSKHEKSILAACAERFKYRKVVRGFLVVEVGLPVA